MWDSNPSASSQNSRASHYTTSSISFLKLLSRLVLLTTALILRAFALYRYHPRASPTELEIFLQFICVFFLNDILTYVALLSVFEAVSDKSFNLIGGLYLLGGLNVTFIHLNRHVVFNKRFAVSA